MKNILFLLLALTSLASCKTYSDDDVQSFDEKIKSYLKKKNIDCTRSSSGLYYKILNEGEGNLIKLTDMVTFTYKGYFLNGEVFDNQKTPVEFQVRQMIGAWKEIMVELKSGGKAFLIAPPQLGYGDRELDDIPAHSILVYELEIHGVR